MYNIILFCTVHTKIGKCNSRRLYKIIEDFRPQIIFEELSHTAFNECYGVKNRLTLETSAIKRYLSNNKIGHIPVVGSELTTDLDKKFEILTKNNSYRSLLKSLNSLKKRYGFKFLNSQQCEDLFDKLTTLERQIHNEIDDIVVSRIFQFASRAIETYEYEIIKNIYDYSSKNEYSKALMFIGAAHRKSIMQKIKEYEKEDKLKLNWTFYKSDGI